MYEYQARVTWRRTEGEDFIRAEYSRGHEWAFDGGATIPASASPSVVPLPYAIEANVDPEEAFVASLSSCHMLLFLSIAAKMRYIVDTYIDNAFGIMEKDASGQYSITRVVLRPDIAFSGDRPGHEQIEKMHRQSHRQCYIANSVKTEVTTEISP